MSKKPATKKQSDANLNASGMPLADMQGNPLRPGTPVLYWTGDGRGPLEAFPGMLATKMMDGKWAINFMQRSIPSFRVTIDYSEKPRLHHWTFPEAYDDYSG